MVMFKKQECPYVDYLVKRAALVFALVFALLFTLFSPSIHAAKVIVSSIEGQPLENAVVEVYYEIDSEKNPSREQNSSQEQKVYQRDAAFHPHVLAVPTGSSVAFPNEDTTRHHLYSFSSAKTFELNLYLQETPPPVSFDQAGVIVLGCNIHDHMQAFIVVSDAPYKATTGADGTLTLPPLPPGEHRVRVWHPHLDDSQEVWWEGTITDADQLSVSLELEAMPLPAPALSPLQQRFKDAT